MDVVLRDGLTAFPFHWQTPAATEKAAYESILAAPHPLAFEYIGFPWATIIDGLRQDAAITAPLLMALKRACAIPASSSRRVTVAQHIYAMEFVELFKTCGITDVFWPHATHRQREIEGIRLHPFPLFPAQTPKPDLLDPERPRRHLANFVGSYNPAFYLTNVREVIFKDANEAGDLMIIRRDAWHFDRAVYEEQLRGLRADDQQLRMEQRNAEEYLSAIRDSWFTFCPTGSGPSTIRIFESLCLGSIPVVLTRDLRLPGQHALWEKAAIIEDDSSAGYSRALETARAMGSEAKREMLKAGGELLEAVSPRAFCRLIENTMANEDAHVACRMKAKEFSASEQHY
jgi:hypothetical protein